MNPNFPAQLQFPEFGGPLSPRTARTLRRFQSHQNLSSKQSSSFGTQPPLPTFDTTSIQLQEPQEEQQHGVAASHEGNSGESSTTPSHGRTRSNSDLTSNNKANKPPPKRPTANRKAGSVGLPIRRSGLDMLLRDGPGKDLAAGLEELRYLVLSTRVDADSDGMV